MTFRLGSYVVAGTKQVFLKTQSMISRALHRDQDRVYHSTIEVHTEPGATVTVIAGGTSKADSAGVALVFVIRHRECDGMDCAPDVGIDVGIDFAVYVSLEGFEPAHASVRIFADRVSKLDVPLVKPE